jgi:hypothetical protein
MPQTWPTYGDEMRFIGDGGFPRQLEEAKLVFSMDDVLVVEDFQLGNSSSTITFKDRPGTWNSAMFNLVEENGFANIGVATAMPGAEGFTMVVFKADDVPAGTWVYEKVEE